jgi:hypothetical protein
MRVASIVLGCAIATPAFAQPEPAKEPPKEEPKPTLEEQVKALAIDVEDVKSENEDLKSELADLKERLAKSKPPPSPSALNPSITAFLNGAGRYDNDPTYTPGGTRIDRRMFMRTAEFDFRAAVDPFADAVAILSLEDEAGEGFGADLEEGYLVLKKLPILDSAPLGLKLKAGRYRAPIGNVNRLHMHDMPWTTRPLPIVKMLGTENGDFFESGYNPVGIDAEVILPQISKSAVQELNLDVVDGGAIAISGHGRRHPAYLGHYNLFFTVADAHDFNVGVSGYWEGGQFRSALVGGDFLYKWKPLAAGEFKSFVLGGEVFWTDRKFQIDLDGDGMAESTAKARSWSWFGFAQYQLNWHVYLGGRYDDAREIDDPDVRTQVAAGYISYYTSEFLRFRLGYEHRWSDIPEIDGDNSVLAEVNVVFGSHPTEPYWVNR